MPLKPPAPVLNRYGGSTEMSTAYESLREQYRWNCPEQFNFARDVIDRWAAHNPGQLALWWVDDHGHEEKHSFGDIAATSRKLANVLTDAGVQRGERIVVIEEPDPVAIDNELPAIECWPPLKSISAADSVKSSPRRFSSSIVLRAATEKSCTSKSWEPTCRTSSKSRIAKGPAAICKSIAAF